MHKKVRLVFVISLIVLSLICFGIMLSAYTSDLTSETLKLFEENGATEVKISKYKDVINGIEVIKEQMNLDSNYVELEEKYKPIDIDETFKNQIEEKTEMEWIPIYTIDTEYGEATMVYPPSLKSEDNYPLYYYIGTFGLNNLKFIENDNIKFSKLIGNKATTDNEVVITSYMADSIIYRGCMAKDNNDERTEEVKYQPKNYNELILSEKFVNICNIGYLKVVGIIDNSEELSKYDIMKKTKASDYWYRSQDEENSEEVEKLYDELFNEICDKHTKFYVSSSFITKMKNIKNSYSAKMSKNNQIIGKNIKTNIKNGKMVTEDSEYENYKIVGVLIDELQDYKSSAIYYSQKVIEPLITGNVHCQEISRIVNT